MAARDIDKLCSAACIPDRKHMTDCPDGKASEPEAQAEANRARQRAIDDGECTRRTAEQDRRGQCAVERSIEAGDVVCRRHQISAPPPKLKKLRKKLDAAKAMERPNTIWISRRKPPDVSPRSEEHTSELQSLMRISYAVFCLKKKIKDYHSITTYTNLLKRTST